MGSRFHEISCFHIGWKLTFPEVPSALVSIEIYKGPATRWQTPDPSVSPWDPACLQPAGVPSDLWRSCTHLIFLFLKYFFIWLCQVLVGACSIFDLHSSLWTLNCGMWDPVTWPGIEPMPLAVKTWSPNHWTTRECLSCSHFRLLIATYALFCLSWNEGMCKLMATRREQDALAGMFFTGCCSAQIFGVTSQGSLKSQGRVDAQQVCLPMFHCIWCAGQ